MGSCPVAVILCSKAGDPSVATLIALFAMETATPSFTSPAAAFRFCGVIRLNAPSSSCFPQRPQLESEVIMVSISFAVREGFVAAVVGLPAGKSANAVTAETVSSNLLSCIVCLLTRLKWTGALAALPCLANPSSAPTLPYRPSPARSSTGYRSRRSRPITLVTAGYIRADRQ